MKCDICGSKSDQGSLVFGQGFTCSEDCAQIAKGRRNAFIQELKHEPLSTMPDALTTGDFERWALKLAIHVLEQLSDAQRLQIADTNPMLLIPEQFSLELKDRIIRFLPKAYVSEAEANGRDRMFYGGTYCFRQPVPKDAIIQACKKAEILH